MSFPPLQVDTASARDYLETVVFPMTPTRRDAYRVECDRVIERARAKAEALHSLLRPDEPAARSSSTKTPAGSHELDVTRQELVDLRSWRFRSEVRLARYRSRAQSPAPLKTKEKVSTGEEPPVEVHAGGVMPGCSNKLCKAYKSDTFVVCFFDQRRRADEGMTPIYTCKACKQEIKY